MDKLPAIAPGAQSSPPPSTPEPSSTAKLQSLKRLKAINEAASRLFKAYPETDYPDPATALATIVTVLNSYPIDVVETATRPETGMQRKFVYPPRTAQIVQFCDEVYADRLRNERFANWGKDAPVIEDRSNRPTYAELVAKYGPTFGIGEPPTARAETTVAAPTIEQVAEAYAETDAAKRLLVAPVGKRQGRGAA